MHCFALFLHRAAPGEQRQWKLLCARRRLRPALARDPHLVFGRIAVSEMETTITILVCGSGATEPHPHPVGRRGRAVAGAVGRPHRGEVPRPARQPLGRRHARLQRHTHLRPVRGSP